MDGEVITQRQTRDVVLVTGELGMTMTFSRYAPGERGPDLHVHREHVDAFYILEGEMTFALGPDGSETTAGPGTYVAVPPNVGHAFRNGSDADVRWLNFHVPDAGFAEYMRAARDGRALDWDSFDMPQDGGRPADLVTIVEGPPPR